MREPEDTPQPFVTVNSEWEGNLLARSLEAHGIETYVFGGTTLAGMGFGPGGISVCVRRSQYDEAVEVLSELRGTGSGRRAVTRDGRCVVCGYDMSGLESPVCPECGTDLLRLGTAASMWVHTVRGESNATAFWAVMLGGVALVSLALLALGATLGWW